MSKDEGPQNINTVKRRCPRCGFAIILGLHNFEVVPKNTSRDIVAAELI